jgi:glycosyltransferase involved in cell wall biosynthesis
MNLTYYFPWGYFYPVRTGAMAVAARHFDYFRSRGIRPRIVVLADETAPERRLFEKHYHWAREISVIGLQYYPEIHRHFEKWTFSGYLAGHAAIAQVPEFRRAFAQPTDVVMLNYVFTSTLLDACTSARWRVLETYDILSRQFLYPDSSPAAIQHQLKTEFDLYKMYDLVIMLNEEEAEIARQRSSARIEYAPRAVNVVDEFEAFGPTLETKYDLLFVACQYRPNVAGIRWFYEHVFRPFLKPHGVTLALAGNVCQAAEICDPAVTLLGPVDDLSQTYRAAKAVVVPLFEGTGVSIKTLEAMGAGKPVIATPCGRRGLSDCEDSLICLPFEAAPAEAAARIVSLCRSPADRESLGRRALDYVKRRFSVEAYGQRMDRLLGDLPSDTPHVAA